MRRSLYEIKNDAQSLKLKHFRPKLRAYNVGCWTDKYVTYEKYYTYAFI